MSQPPKIDAEEFEAFLWSMIDAGLDPFAGIPVEYITPDGLVSEPAPLPESPS